MSAALTAGLIAAALALALAFGTRSWAALAVFGGVAAASVFVPVPPSAKAAVFLACWATVAATALTVHLPRGADTKLSLVLAANAGLWAGAVVAVAGVPGDVVRAVPVVLLSIPAGWLARHRGAIAVKVVASWLVAVAILAAALPIVPTPGYSPDHME